MDVGNISLYIPYCDLNTAVDQTYPPPPIYTHLSRDTSVPYPPLKGSY